MNPENQLYTRGEFLDEPPDGLGSCSLGKELLPVFTTCQPRPPRSLVNPHFQVRLILPWCRLRNNWMDLAFEEWGRGGIVASLLVLGPHFGHLHSSCCFPLLPLHSSLGDLYSESLPCFLEATLLQYA